MFLVLSLLFISAMSHAESVYQWGRWQGVFTAAGADSEREMVVEFTSPNGKGGRGLRILGWRQYLAGAIYAG